MAHKNKFIIEVGKTPESLIFCQFYGPLHKKFQIILHTPKSCACWKQHLATECDIYLVWRMVDIQESIQDALKLLWTEIKPE